MADELTLGPEPEDTDAVKSKIARSRVLMSGMSFDEARYEYSDKFVRGESFDDVHTTHEMHGLLKENKNIEISGQVLGIKDGQFVRSSIRNREEFLKGYKEGNKSFKKLTSKKFKESIDTFSVDAPFLGGGNYVGEPDYLPLLGGPFYKQLYYYDYIRMHAASFYAYHHDPIGRLIPGITQDFGLGRGWRADCDNPIAKMWWDAFSEANDLPMMFRHIDSELTIYGEELIWWLPNNQTKIVFNPTKGETVPRGLIPRIRLIDPSCIWDIVTWPEDISRVLFYQWVAPTQYQTYTHDEKTNVQVPSSKFIFQQIPGPEVMHFKQNCVSNEKRGRSDLFPVLGYMKRLRDSVNYKIIGLQKASAWGIDTTIEGDQNDINSYISDQQAGGTIAPAGSEFVHTAAIKREYLANVGGKTGSDDAFNWALSMIAMGTRIPVAYMGAYLSGAAQTRASAMVATEPVAKKFEARQDFLRHILKCLAKRLFESVGIQADIEFTFPEIVTQDRTAKLKDLALAGAEKWLSQKRCAQIAAKELGIANYDYDTEMEQIKEEQAEAIDDGSVFGVNPLSKTGLSTRQDIAAPDAQNSAQQTPTGITSQNRKDVRDNRGA